MYSFSKLKKILLFAHCLPQGKIKKILCNRSFGVTIFQISNSFSVITFQISNSSHVFKFIFKTQSFFLIQQYLHVENVLFCCLAWYNNKFIARYTIDLGQLQATHGYQQSDSEICNLLSTGLLHFQHFVRATHSTHL